MRICTAHRGWSSRAPENTLSAIKLALAEPKIDKIEIDVQLTKDEIPVVIHDFTLERTSTGKGLVKDHTYEELLQLDFGSWFSDQYAGEKIPTLSEVLTLMKGKKTLVLEIKTAGYLYPNIAEKVVQTLQDHNMQQEVVVKSFDHGVMKKVKSLDPTLKTGLLIYGNLTLLKEQLAYTGASFISTNFAYLTKEFAKEIIDSGIEIMSWTPNHPFEIDFTTSIHPAIEIITNYPERVFAK